MSFAVGHARRDQSLADSEEWQHLNEIEMQVYSEMDSLKNSIKRMQDDAAKFADLDGFKRECQVMMINTFSVNSFIYHKY